MKTINMLEKLLSQNKDYTHTNSKQIPYTHTHSTPHQNHIQYTIHHNITKYIIIIIMCI